MLAALIAAALLAAVPAYAAGKLNVNSASAAEAEAAGLRAGSGCRGAAP